MAHTKGTVVVGDRGRVVLPASVRTELGLEPGTPLLVIAESDGSLRLRPYRAVADESRGMLAGRASADASMVAELLAERRDEAARENTE